MLKCRVNKVAKFSRISDNLKSICRTNTVKLPPDHVHQPSSTTLSFSMPRFIEPLEHRSASYITIQIKITYIMCNHRRIRNRPLIPQFRQLDHLFVLLLCLLQRPTNGTFPITECPLLYNISILPNEVFTRLPSLGRRSDLLRIMTRPYLTILVHVRAFRFVVVSALGRKQHCCRPFAHRCPESIVLALVVE